VVVALDEAHRLSEARSRIERALAALLDQGHSERVGVHLAFVGRRNGLPDVESQSVRPNDLSVAPLPLRAAAPHLPGRRPLDVLRAYGVFGGIPAVLALLDTEVTVGTNVRRLLMAEGAPFADAPLAWLEREIQTPARYAAILQSLSHAESDWARLHASIPDLGSSGQVAPYLKRLGEMGMIHKRRSLDARPRSRAARYATTDPFLSFYYRFVLPYHLAGDRSDPRRYYAREIRPRIDDHLEGVLPKVARGFMELDAAETLGAAAREGGSLWGRGVEIPVAGTLTSGAAYYGACRWRSIERDPAPVLDMLRTIDDSVRETRYGFGRERRIRLIFLGRPSVTAVRRQLERRRDVEVIPPSFLVGE
jgi:hypothetical protein